MNGGIRRRLSPQERRAQIVTATLDTVAALGYRAATFSRIAERGGLSSTRLISYHFAGRDELMTATVTHVYGALAEHVAGRLTGAADARAELAAYLRAVAEFVDTHRTPMQALTRIFVGLRDEAGESRVYDADSDGRAIGAVEEILRRGQASGVFRTDFDPFAVGSMAQRAVDGLPFLLETRPDLDLPAYADEVVRTFDLATRPEPVHASSEQVDGRPGG